MKIRRFTTGSHLQKLINMKNIKTIENGKFNIDEKEVLK